MVVRACRLLLTGARPAVLILPSHHFSFRLSMPAGRFPIARFTEDLFGPHRPYEIQGGAGFDSEDSTCQCTR